MEVVLLIQSQTAEVMLVYFLSSILPALARCLQFLFCLIVLFFGLLLRICNIIMNGLLQNEHILLNFDLALLFLSKTSLFGVKRLKQNQQSGKYIN